MRFSLSRAAQSSSTLVSIRVSKPSAEVVETPARRSCRISPRCRRISPAPSLTAKPSLNRELAVEYVERAAAIERAEGSASEFDSELTPKGKRP